MMEESQGRVQDDYTFPYHLKDRYRKLDESEILLESSKSFENDEDTFRENPIKPKENIAVLKMILDKHKEVKEAFEVSADKKEILKNLFDRDYKEKKPKDILLFWHRDKKDDSPYLCLTINSVFGVNEAGEKFKETLNDFRYDVFFTEGLKGNKIIEGNVVIKKNRGNKTLFKDFQEELLILKEEQSFSDFRHPLLDEDIESREGYLRFLFEMINCDGKVYSSEINKLFEIAKLLKIENGSFLSMIETYYPYDSYKSEIFSDKFKKQLFSNNIKYKYLFLKELISIIYADSKRVKSETDLMNNWAKLIEIDQRIVEKLYDIHDSKKEAAKERSIGALKELLLKLNLSESIIEILSKDF